MRKDTKINDTPEIEQVVNVLTGESEKWRVFQIGANRGSLDGEILDWVNTSIYDLEKSRILY